MRLSHIDVHVIMWDTMHRWENNFKRHTKELGWE